MFPVTEATLVSWVRPVLQETLALKEWPACLVPLGKKVSEVHPGWMVSRACLGCQGDPGIQESKESLEGSAFQDQRARLGCQAAKEAGENRVPQDRLPPSIKKCNSLKATKEM